MKGDFDALKTITKMGRPPKDPADKLSKNVTVRMTEDEYNNLKDNLGDRSFSEGLRDILISFLGKEND